MFRIISQLDEQRLLNDSYSVVKRWVNRFKKEGVSEEDINNFMNNINKLSHYFNSYFAFDSFLSKNVNINGSFEEINNRLIQMGDISDSYSENIASYMIEYPFLRGVPIEVLEKYLSDAKTTAAPFKVAIFWRNHPELIEDKSYDGAFLYITTIMTRLGINDINYFTGLDNFIIRFKMFFELPIMRQILKDWGKIDSSVRGDIGGIMLSYCDPSIREYIRDNYSLDLYPILLEVPSLIGVNSELIERTYKKAKEGRVLLSFGNIQKTGKLLTIFGENLDKIVSIPDLLKTDGGYSYLPNFAKKEDYKYMDRFIIRFKNFLTFYSIKEILSNWDKIDLDEREHPEKILIEYFEEDQRETVIKNYSVNIWPILIEFPEMIDMGDPSLIKGVYNRIKHKRDIYESDIDNINKMLKIFGEDYDKFININNFKELRKLMPYLPELEKKENYKYMDQFLMKFRNYLDVNMIKMTLSRWGKMDLTEKENYENLILKNIPSENIERIKKNYPAEVFPMLITSPSLIGINPRVLVDIYNKIVETGQKFSDMDIRSLGKLASIFGNKFYDCIKSYDLKDIHNKSNYLPEFERRSDYKYMDIFLRTYKDWGDPKVKIIINNWKNFPEERKRPPHDLEKLYNYLVEEIFPEMYKNLKVNNKDFLLESFQHGINYFNYNKYENLYIKGQSVPLPRWTGIEPIEFKGYRGYFVPRSDPRTMFIGNYVTCCQRVGDEAETSAVHSQISPYGALFLIENMKTGKPTAQSWVWENRGNIVFDDIECPAMKGGNPNDKIAGIIMGIYKEVARRIKGLGMKSVSVGYTSYGVDLKYLKDLPKMEEEFVEGPEDEGSFVEEYCKEKDDGLYMDSDEEKRFLASIYNKMLRISNRIDGENSRISDKIDRLIWGTT